MKATLSFDLPEEQEEFKRARDGSSYRDVILDLDTDLRNKIKYGNEQDETLDRDTLQHVRTELWKLIKEHGVAQDFD